MKRYLLFAGVSQPEGGWRDYVNEFCSWNEAIRHADTLEWCNWWHIVDTMTKSIVLLKK